MHQGLPAPRWGEVPVLVLPFDQQLTRFIHPRQMLLRDALPRPALGKVQKAALRGLVDGQRGTSAAPQVAA